jgi:uncharacterized protein (DUF433 family)
MQRFDRITWNPPQMNGQPCPWNEAHGAPGCGSGCAFPNREDLFRKYPELEAEDIQHALAFAAANLEESAAETDAA